MFGILADMLKIATLGDHRDSGEERKRTFRRRSAYEEEMRRNPYAAFRDLGDTD